MRIGSAPDGGSGFGVMQLELEGHAGRETVSGDLAEVVQMPAKQIIAANVAPQGIHMLIAARGAQFTKQEIADRCVNDVVVAIEVRCCNRSEQQSDGIRRWILGGNSVVRNSELIELAWPSRAAAVHDCETEDE